MSARYEKVVLLQEAPMFSHCFRLRGLEKADEQDPREGEQLFSVGENLREPPEQSARCAAGPRQGGLDIQVQRKPMNE